MRTQEWHALNHLCEGITHVGWAISRHARIYEASYKRFKSFYANCFRQGRTAMSKLVSIQNSETKTTQEDFFESLFPEKSINGSTEEACSADSSILARSGTKHSLFALETVMDDKEMSTRRPSNMDEGTMVAGRLFKILQSEGSSVFIQVLMSYLVEREDKLKVVRYKVNRIQNSVYVSSCKAPTLKNKERDGFIEIFNDGWRVT